MLKKKELRILEKEIVQVETNIVSFLFITFEKNKIKSIISNGDDNMNLVEELKKDMITAMKEKDKETLTVIRMVKAALDKERIDKKAEVNDELLIDVVNKQIKMRNDSIEEFKKANRTDLVEQTEQELTVLKKYLPEQLSKEEVIEIIEAAIKEVNATGIRDMGNVMKTVSPQVKGKADMKTVSEIIKSKLN